MKTCQALVLTLIATLGVSLKIHTQFLPATLEALPVSYNDGVVSTPVGNVTVANSTLVSPLGNVSLPSVPALP